MTSDLKGPDRFFLAEMRDADTRFEEKEVISNNGTEKPDSPFALLFLFETTSIDDFCRYFLSILRTT
jgi:hypothetical protein